jgi:hypothetical protein
MRYATDIALGLVVTGARAGRIALAPVRVAARVPVVGAPLRYAENALALDGQAARIRLDAIVTEQLASPQLELMIDRIVAAVLDDVRTERVIDRVLASAQFEHILRHVASSPAMMEALSHHTETLTEEMVSDVRERAQRVDDLAERTVRSWLRRPRPQPT